MSVSDAIKQVLYEAREPLHSREITRRMLDRGLWTTQGKTPEATVNAYLASDIKDNGSSSLFQRTTRGVFALRSWGLPEYTENRQAIGQEISSQDTADQGVIKGPSYPTYQPDHNLHTLSFTDAAESVLRQFGSGKPMHYRDITQKALDLRILRTSGQTPEATMYAQILTEIAREERLGKSPRFVKLGKGRVSLTQWQQDEQSPELAKLIERHNQNVRKQLHERLHQMNPTEFEELISELLIALGLESVSVTEPSHDGGIDVRGVLVIGEVVRLKMAVQVKRWKENVQVDTVRQVRGSLSTHERGLVITTSDFSKGAREEATYSDRSPIFLMDGEQLVSLLIEYNIGVQRTSYNLLELNDSKES